MAPHQSNVPTGQLVPDFLPEGVSEDQIAAIFKRLVSSVDLEKVARGDQVRANGLLIDRMGVEKKGKWSLIHFFGQYLLDYFVPDNSSRPPQTSEAESMLLGFATDPEVFRAAFSEMNDLFSQVLARLPSNLSRRAEAYHYFDAVAARSVGAPPMSTAEDLVLYPASHYVRHILESDIPAAPQQIDELRAQVDSFADGIPDMLRPDLASDVRETALREVEDVRMFIHDWITRHVQTVSA